MTPAERADIANAIWLCRGCARRVDRDETAYPPELLRLWRAEAEGIAYKELDTRLPAHDDAQAQLLAAVTGHASRLLPTLVHNAHAASAEAIERLDPRFHIESSYDRGITRYRLEAREVVPFRLTVPPERAEEWGRGVAAALDAGAAFEIDADGFTVDGSALLAYVFEEDEPGQSRRLTFSPEALPARVKWGAVSLAGTKDAFDDITGTVAVGASRWTFMGDVWGGLAKLAIEMGYVAPPWEGKFSLRFNIDCWVGHDIRSLPYFDALVAFCLRNEPDEILDVGLFIDGQRRAAMSAPIATIAASNPNQNALLGYLVRAAEIARRLGVAILLPKYPKVSQEEAEALARVYALLSAPSRMTAEHLACNPTCTLLANANGANVLQLGMESEAMVVRAPQDVPSVLRIFTETVLVPPIHVTLHGVHPRLIDRQQHVEEGEAVRVELVPADDFWMAYELDEARERHPSS